MSLADLDWIVVFTSLLMCIFVAVLQAMYRKGDSRAKSIGFIFGAVSYLLVLRTFTISNLLLSHYLLFSVELLVDEAKYGVTAVKWGADLYDTSMFSGHVIVAFLLGILGGRLANYYQSQAKVRHSTGSRP